MILFILFWQHDLLFESKYWLFNYCGYAPVSLVEPIHWFLCVIRSLSGMDKMVRWVNESEKPFSGPIPSAVRLFDLVETSNAELKPCFYFALRNTLVADNLHVATDWAFKYRQRFRVVTLQVGFPSFYIFVWKIFSYYIYAHKVLKPVPATIIELINMTEVARRKGNS